MISNNYINRQIKTQQMKHLLTLLIAISTSSIFAQEKLNFDKKLVQSEDQWITFPADTLGSYPYGFIYIDPQAGLTFNYENSFTIDSNGKFILEEQETTASMKYRLDPRQSVLVAFIPESKFSELKIEKTPDWLSIYKKGENSVEQLYNKGYRYNGWGECEKALEFLEKAKKTDIEYKGLRVELAYSYNCLKRYSEAIEILKKAVKDDPLDAYINKELIYAYVNNGNLKEAKNICRKVVKDCPDKTYNAENAYNILQTYYMKNDIANFNDWLAESGSYLLIDKNLKEYVEIMIAELKK